MKLKLSVGNIVAFLLLAGAVYLWGPGFNGLVRTACTLLLYMIVFGACFVVVGKGVIKRK